MTTVNNENSAIIFSKAFLNLVILIGELELGVDITKQDLQQVREKAPSVPDNAIEILRKKISATKEIMQDIPAYCNNLGAYGIRHGLFEGEDGLYRAAAYETLARALDGKMIRDIRTTLDEYQPNAPLEPESKTADQENANVAITDQHVVGLMLDNLIKNKTLVQILNFPYMLLNCFDGDNKGNELTDIGMKACKNGYFDDQSYILFKAAYNITAIALHAPKVNEIMLAYADSSMEEFRNSRIGYLNDIMKAHDLAAPFAHEKAMGYLAEASPIAAHVLKTDPNNNILKRFLTKLVSDALYHGDRDGVRNAYDESFKNLSTVLPPLTLIDAAAEMVKEKRFFQRESGLSKRFNSQVAGAGIIRYILENHAERYPGELTKYVRRSPAQGPN